MPAQTGKDNEGCFYRWGREGKKYYYECGNKDAREEAKKKAIKQGVAIGDFDSDLVKRIMRIAKRIKKS